MLGVIYRKESVAGVVVGGPCQKRVEGVGIVLDVVDPFQIHAHIVAGVGIPSVHLLDECDVTHYESLVEGVEIGVEDSHDERVAHLHLLIDEIGGHFFPNVQPELLCDGS